MRWRCYTGTAATWLLVDLGHPSVVGDGAVVVTFGTVGKAAVVVGADVFRIDLDNLGVVGNGAVVVALGSVGDTAAEVGTHVPRIDLDGHCGVFDGAVVVALGTKGESAVVEGAKKLRIDLDRLGCGRQSRCRCRPWPGRQCRGCCRRWLTLGSIAMALAWSAMARSLSLWAR